MFMIIPTTVPADEVAALDVADDDVGDTENADGIDGPQLQRKNPLHGITLEAMVTDLVAFFGWEDLGRRIPIRCFNNDPTIVSSLKFLRKTPWARAKVEGLFLFAKRERNRRARQSAAAKQP
jgi:uncharacterized protein (DUF2132 family)